MLFNLVVGIVVICIVSGLDADETKREGVGIEQIETNESTLLALTREINPLEVPMTGHEHHRDSNRGMNTRVPASRGYIGREPEQPSSYQKAAGHKGDMNRYANFNRDSVQVEDDFRREPEQPSSYQKAASHKGDMNRYANFNRDSVQVEDDFRREPEQPSSYQKAASHKGDMNRYANFNRDSVQSNQEDRTNEEWLAAHKAMVRRGEMNQEDRTNEEWLAAHKAMVRRGEMNQEDRTNEEWLAAHKAMVRRGEMNQEDRTNEEWLAAHKAMVRRGEMGEPSTLQDQMTLEDRNNQEWLAAHKAMVRRGEMSISGQETFQIPSKMQPHNEEESASQCTHILSKFRKVMTFDKVKFCSVGMKDGRIVNDDITATSFFDVSSAPFPNGESSAPWFGRLDAAPLQGNNTGSWIPLKSAIGEWMQVDLRSPISLSGVVTQGSPLFDSYVADYKIAYGNTTSDMTTMKGKDGSDKIFFGNYDAMSPLWNIFPHPVVARYVRLMPIYWVGNIALRMELLTC